MASDDIEFSDTLSLDMSTVVPTISGPKRPQDKVFLTDAAQNFKENFKKNTNRNDFLKVKLTTQISRYKMVQY